MVMKGWAWAAGGCELGWGWEGWGRGGVGAAAVIGWGVGIGGMRAAQGCRAAARVRRLWMLAGCRTVAARQAVHATVQRMLGEPARSAA